MCDGCDTRASFVQDREGAFVECLNPNSFSIIIIFIIFPIYFDAFHRIAVIFVVYPVHANTHTLTTGAHTLTPFVCCCCWCRHIQHNTVQYFLSTARYTQHLKHMESVRTSNEIDSLSLSLSCSIYRWLYVRFQLRASLCVLIVLLSKWGKKMV